MSDSKNNKKKKKKQAVAAVPKPPFWVTYKEVLALALVAMSVYLGLALYSYAPTDPAFFQERLRQGAVANWGGVIGSYLSGLGMRFLGWGSYVLIGMMLFYAVAFLLELKSALKSSVILGWGLFLTTACLGFSMFSLKLGMDPGGAFGTWMFASLHVYVGAFGRWIFWVTGCLIAFSLIFRMSYRYFFQWPAKMTQGFLAWARQTWQALTGWYFETWHDFKRDWDQKRQAKKNKPKVHQPEANHQKQSPTMSTATINTAVQMPSRPSTEVENQNQANKKNISIVYPKQDQETPEQETQRLERESAPEAKEKKSPYTMPSLDLLEKGKAQDVKIDQATLLKNAEILEAKLKDFGVLGKVLEVQPGPVVTMYEFEPAAGVKVNKITALGDDLTLALKALSVRIAPIAGKSVVGIEVANPIREFVYIKDIIDHHVFRDHPSKLTISLGKDISGKPVVGNLRKMPHLLVAGATGSGKSVSVNSMLASILYKSTPDEVRMILVDPKMLELSLYNEIPHLLLPVVTDPRKASAALKWGVREMERRYRLMSELSVRNIEGYNAKVDAYMRKNPRASYEEHMEVKPETHEGRLPFIMIVIDELADLMMVASKDVEDSIIRLAQMARASGIHLLLATQRPSVDVITGIIKANMPSRIAFQVSSKIDSRTILDANGAEQLLGAGDMLYMPPGTSKLQRLHGSFISDDEVGRITDFWKSQAKPEYNEEILKPAVENGITTTGNPEEDEMYLKALNVVRERKVASISYIQRKLRIGYNRAARLVERMDDDGFLAPGEVGKPREVRISDLP